ncbi:MAG: hypothetical protein IID08_04215 [Candidatus Hydrogenedentes bacterium]|nr:hypothetical protein [Candidatus Hydrogenedentota bacterium]
MSLKTFHIVFIGAATLVSILFSLWSLREYLDSGGLGFAATACCGIVLSAGLLYYGVRFVKKLRDLSFL